MGSVGKKIKKVVKKVMRPKVLLPLAAIALGGPALMGGLKGAAIGAGAAPGSLMASGMAKSALASKATIGSALKSGIGALAKKVAMSPITTGVMTGLKNPFSVPGALTYGGLGALGMMLGSKGGDEQGSDPIDRKALNQANYNMMRMYGQNAGYTNEDINTIYGPLGQMMGGEYTEVAADPNQRVRRQFPGTNYPIFTTQGAANGGRIGYAEGDAVKKGIVVEGDSLKKFDDSGSYIPRSYRRIGLDGDLFVDNSGYESLRHPPVSDFTVGALKEKQRQLDEFRKKYKNAIGDIHEVTEPALQEYFDTYSSVEGAMEKAIIRRKLADIAKKHKFDRLASYQKPSEEFIEDIMMDFDPYVDLPSQMNTGGRVGRPGFWLGGLLEKLSGDPEDMEASENDPLRMTAEEEAAFNQIRNTINYMNANNLPVDPTEIMDLSGANLSDVDRELMQERVDAYLDPEQKANGGRIGLANGGGPEWGSYKDWLEGSGVLDQYPELEDMTPDEQQNFLELIGLLRANGGRIHKNIGGIMNAGSIPQTMQNPADMNMQLDGRGGGFIPMGEAPQADDVPAMLSKDEFVMTRDAVKGMGGGDANVGAQRMYDLMNQLEAKV